MSPSSRTKSRMNLRRRHRRLLPVLPHCFSLSPPALSSSISSHHEPLVGVIGPSLGFSENGAGLVAMASLLDYTAGLFFLVPLADLVENRRLVLRILVSALVMAVAAVFAPNGWSLLVFPLPSWCCLFGHSDLSTRSLRP